MIFLESPEEKRVVIMSWPIRLHTARVARGRVEVEVQLRVVDLEDWARLAFVLRV